MAHVSEGEDRNGASLDGQTRLGHIRAQARVLLLEVSGH